MAALAVFRFTQQCIIMLVFKKINHVNAGFCVYLLQLAGSAKAYVSSVPLSESVKLFFHSTLHQVCTIVERNT